MQLRMRSDSMLGDIYRTDFLPSIDHGIFGWGGEDVWRRVLLENFTGEGLVLWSPLGKTVGRNATGHECFGADLFANDGVDWLLFCASASRFIRSLPLFVLLYETNQRFS